MAGVYGGGSKKTVKKSFKASTKGRKGFGLPRRRKS